MDIRQQQFTVRMFRGFDVQEVDTFLEDVAQDYEALIKENALLKEQLQVLEDRTRGLEDREKVLQTILLFCERPGFLQIQFSIFIHVSFGMIF